MMLFKARMKLIEYCTDYIADSVDAFLTDIGSEIGTNEPMHLGFTFS